MLFVLNDKWSSNLYKFLNLSLQKSFLALFHSWKEFSLNNHLYQELKLQFLQQVFHLSLRGLYPPNASYLLTFRHLQQS